MTSITQRRDSSLLLPPLTDTKFSPSLSLLLSLRVFLYIHNPVLPLNYIPSLILAIAICKFTNLLLFKHICTFNTLYTLD